jgi:hypothetical protein
VNKAINEVIRTTSKVRKNMTVSIGRQSVLLGGLLLSTLLLAGSVLLQPSATREAQALWGGDAPALQRGHAHPPATPAALGRKLTAGHVG